MKAKDNKDIDFVQNRFSDTSTLLIGERALLNGIRIDGRQLDSYRNINIEFIGPPGSVIISFGNTTVFSSVCAEVVEPNSERPNEGFLFFNAELMPLTSGLYEPGKASELEQNISCFIESVFKESGSLNLESLCITSGKHVWAIRVYIHVLQDDGNLFDVCSFSALASLLHYRIQEVKVVDDTVKISEINWHKGTPLNIYNIPIPINILILTEERFLVDPTIFEEQINSTQIFLVFNQFGEVIWVQKPGGIPVMLDIIKTAIEIGERKTKQLYSLLRKELASNEEMNKNVLKYVNKHYSTPVIDLE
ncbi:3' exoribonuclease family, domain 1 containing protein [Theileria equi strain WA]|uniref:3' exoribonuclease family, domain 1 containing protein n=1 Tax=Theileria equi strain WA TaxID=1537102 RepID=L1LD30_THEEQ|nr:3' exoribonuclease family, domain 1 containing protein [Theileria equi strain WA]EKX73083.1 3' exoribonuclease family, domain 1 containing protein [Theileria equi strain WA]|eukprot:XP_004832535.1 3' exoribonuclease family, domain 1 containing protein [Theileria equi strain WA]